MDMSVFFDAVVGLITAMLAVTIFLVAVIVAFIIALIVILVPTAQAAPIVHNGPVFRWAVMADTHRDYDTRQGQDTTAMAFRAADTFSADGALVLGDLYGARQSDIDGDGDWDCSVDRFWSASCEYPSSILGAGYAAAVDLWDPNNELPDLWLLGNHDGHPPLPGVAALNLPDAWQRKWLDPSAQPCVVDVGREYARCDLVVADAGQSAAWTILLLHDQSSHQDRAIGGRCDLRDYQGLTSYRQGCSPRGWPTGVITPYQIVWLEAQVALAAAEGRRVVVATHQPVPNTVVLSGRGASYVPQCSTNILVQAPPPASHHYPRDADLLPLRTDLDTPIPGDPYGRTPLQVAVEWEGAVVRWYPGFPPDEMWGLNLVRRYPGTVLVWASGHNHLPVPDLVDHEGRGAIYRDALSGTAFLAHGAVTRWWVTTAGAGHPQMALLDLGADGTWKWTRLSIQSHAAGLSSHGCGGTAKLPPVRPAPWLDLPVEVGP